MEAQEQFWQFIFTYNRKIVFNVQKIVNNQKNINSYNRKEEIEYACAFFAMIGWNFNVW